VSTVADFVGRTADLLAFQGSFPHVREQLVQMTLVRSGEGGFLCTGVQKLAQRLLLVLLTKKGSMRYLPAFGTAFMIRAERGIWRTQSDVMMAFTAAKLDLVRQMREQESDDDPPDERLAMVNLIGIGLNADSVSLRISVTTQAGTNYQFIAPVRVPTK